MTLRYRHLELTELENDGALTLPALTPMPEAQAASVLEWLGRAVLFMVRVVVFTLGVTARIVLPILSELVCIALAALCCGAGLLGRVLDHAGRAAACRSWIITASIDALAQLPPPARRVDRERRTAITVRAVR